MPDRYTIVLEGEYRESLENLAQQLGFTWGDRGNVKDLVQAIARGQLAVGESTAFSPDQRRSLGRAVIAAAQRGDWIDALLLGETFEIFASEDESLKGYVAATLEPLRRPWVAQLFKYIEQQQPFTFAYQDASSRMFGFSVFGAELVAHERRTYLDCWCMETESNQDIEGLQHNWCFRLDRIIEASITSLEGQWRSLDRVESEFHLRGGLAHAYEPQSADTLIEWIDSDTRRVKRSITSSFWFLREVLRYGSNCSVIAPEILRTKLLETLASMIQEYKS